MRIVYMSVGLSEKPLLVNRCKDFTNFLRNYRQQYYKKTDEAQFLKTLLFARKGRKAHILVFFEVSLLLKHSSKDFVTFCSQAKPSSTDHPAKPNNRRNSCLLVSRFHTLSGNFFCLCKV